MLVLADSPAELPVVDSLLQTLLAISLTGVIIFRPVYAPGDGGDLIDLTYEYLNPAAQRMLGLAECPAETFLTRYPHAHETGVFAFYCVTFQSGQAGRFDINYQHDGLDNFFHLAALRSGERLVVSFTDTADHDRSLVEEALRGSQAREQAARAEAEIQRGELQRVYEQAPVAIAIFRGADLVVEVANQAMLILWDKSVSQVLGQPLFEILPELRDQGYQELFAGVLQTGTPVVVHEHPVTMWQHGRRETSLFNFTYQPLRNELGCITGVITIATEVTQLVAVRQQVQQLNEELAAANEALQVNNQKFRTDNSQLAVAQRQLNQLNQDLEARVVERTNAQLRARAEADSQRDYLQRIFEQAPVAIAVFRGPQYVIEQANPVVCALWGRTQAQALHTPLFVLLPEAAGQGFEELLNGVMATGEPYVATELPSVINRNDRTEMVYWNFVYQPLRDAQGLITGVTVVAIDVSEQMTARQQLQVLNKELLGANEGQRITNEELRGTNQQLTRTNVDLDNFIYTASHDLKAPIANIEGLLHALLAELPAATQQAVAVAPLLAMMQLSVERFQATITQLTTLSQLQQAHAQPTETVNLAAVVDDVRFDLTPLLTLTATELTVDVDALSIVSFSAKNLRSLVYNLLSNAVKYRAPDRPPVVALRCHRVGAVMVLEVQDNGLGLTPAQQSRLFGMFQRLHTHVEGSGIGLYMVKKIVENAGGTVRVQSQTGVGSMFTITFPC